MKKIALIAGSRETCESLERQLNGFLPSAVQVKVYCVDEGMRPVEKSDLMVFSSEALYEEVSDSLNLSDEIPCIIGRRTINYDSLEQIVSIPPHSKVLLANDLYESALEVKQAMEEIGLLHMALTLYYPGCPVDTSQMTYCITPGERKVVPEGIEHIIDIGSRIFDFKTIARILSELNLLEGSSASFSKMYLEKIINVARSLAESRAQVLELNTSLDRVIDGFEQGLIIFDAQEKIVLFNDALKKILKISSYQLVDGSLNRVIYHKKLLGYLLHPDNTLEFELLVDGNEYLVSKFKINQSDLTCASFKSLKAHHSRVAIKQEAIRKGYVAKYKLGDIVGVSNNVVQLKKLIEKLACTDMTILIHGESGTGKELVASAIHNQSDRADAPFLAVNFSALPDDLIESELFGYADGAFTGAKKGGKKGLFEEASGGTIFLDEIGDISLKVQSRLLRVLEEKEVMRVGGNEITPVDVRIIAATNKDLLQMVENRTFREDLYFRLKLGYLYLEPLRNRREDIPMLLETMVDSMTSKKVDFHETLIQKLKNYQWHGNVRELKNTINYMLAVRKSDLLTISDLPDETFFRVPQTWVSSMESMSQELYLPEDQKHFLKLIYEMKFEDQKVTRRTLSNQSVGTSFSRSENQVRRLLLLLKEGGYIRLHKGRQGIELTDLARGYMEKVYKG